MAQWIANVILLAGTIAAVWYAWETSKMRRQMIRPKLVFLTPRHHPEHLEDAIPVDLVIRNVGDGAAINVVVERVQDEQGFKLRFEPENISLLEKDKQVALTMRPVEGTHHPNMTIILDDPSISLKIVARYVDVEGSVFRTSTLIGGGAKPPFIRDEET
jgi:hypothetical protein